MNMEWHNNILFTLSIHIVCIHYHLHKWTMDMESAHYMHLVHTLHTFCPQRYVVYKKVTTA